MHDRDHFKTLYWLLIQLISIKIEQNKLIYLNNYHNLSFISAFIVFNFINNVSLLVDCRNSCQAFERGYFQSCGGCEVYRLCSGVEGPGVLVPCPQGLHWDQIVRYK